MEPNLQQKQWLKDYLRSVLTYRETYEEVYDHVLLALENRPADRFFESSVSAIIEGDFGGSNGLMRLEENCKSGVIIETRKAYWRYFVTWLKFPRIIFTALGFLSIYCTIAYFSKISVLVTLVALFCIMIIAPVFLLSVRGFKIGHLFGDKKELLKDSVFRRMAYRPIFYIWISNAFPFRFINFGHNKNIGPIFFSASFVVLIIHVICFLKLYKDEFKISITQ
jgi:hypothetical protein